MNRNMFPICAKCNNSVEKIERYAEDMFSRHVTYKVFCHGESEETELKRDILIDSKSIKPGIAFKDVKQLKKG